MLCIKISREQKCYSIFIVISKSGESVAQILCSLNRMEFKHVLNPDNGRNYVLWLPTQNPQILVPLITAEEQVRTCRI